jgi:hypothetical protein
MGLPANTSINAIGKELGLKSADLEKLTPRARKLTKGDVIALLGVETNRDAVVAYAVSGAGQLLPKPRVTPRTAALTVRDRASLGQAFGSVQQNWIAQARRRPTDGLIGPLRGSGVGTELTIDISCCCCCPCTCCCAATVTKPARHVA